MELRSLSTGGVVVDFTLSDCPVLVKEKYIALFGRENSDLLYQVYLCRGQKFSDEVGVVYEGDILEDEAGTELGILFYDVEWRLLNKDDNVKKLPEFSHIKVKRGSVSSLVHLREVVKCRPNMIFKYAEKVCSLMAVVGKTKTNAVMLSGVNFPMKDESGCSLGTGYFYNSRAVFYGDVLNDYGKVELKDGVPVAVNAAGKVTLLSKFCELNRRQV